MLAPKGYRQVIDSRAYTAAQRVASKRDGLLRFTFPMLLLSAAGVCGAAALTFGQWHRVWYVVTAACLLVVAAWNAVLWLSVLPRAVMCRAQKDYKTYDRLSNPVDVTFSSDELTLTSAVMTRRVEYAKTRLCIETPLRFVLVTDDGVRVILEKACFAEETTVSFLREVFARRYVKERRG